MTCSDHCGASFHTGVQIHTSEPSGKANELSKGGWERGGAAMNRLPIPYHGLHFIRYV